MSEDKTPPDDIDSTESIVEPSASPNRIGNYRILQKIGQGGMGVVWKAEDTTLRRPVALKFLTQGGFDAEVLRARFLREARLAAVLNHPSICSIYEVAEVESGDLQELPSGEQLPLGTPFLALEFIDGHPLNAVLRKFGALPLDDVLRIAAQVAEGLAAAHEQEIVHRDLKPANIMLTLDERAKILDFGLAKHLSPTDSSDAVTTDAETISEELTLAGMVIGTVAYMSPEQARGQPLDSRSDVFSFGVMLYEMVAGHRPFRGETTETTRLKIIEADPEPLPDSCGGIPPELERIIWRCLRKKPADRFNDTRDLVVALEDLRSGSASERAGRTESGAGERTEPRRKELSSRASLWLRVAPWILIPLAAIAVWRLRPDDLPAQLPTTRSTVLMPEGERLASYFRPGLAVSPDGRTLAFVSGIVDDARKKPESSRIQIRRLDEWDTQPLRGTDGARWPVFSPDGQWIAYSTSQGEIKKVRVSGGERLTLCECNASYGLDWGPDGTIVFAEEIGGLQRVSASGGEPQAMTHPDEAAHEVSHRLPHFLPGGDAVLFTSLPYKTILLDWKRAKVFVVSLLTGEKTLLIEGGSDARYAPTGHLLFAREGRLMAAPFALDRLEVTGPEVPVLEGVSHAIHTGSSLRETGAAFFSLSPSGTLAFVPGSVLPEMPREVVWIDRQGREEPLGVEPKDYMPVRVSPDGRRALLTATYRPYTVWLFDLERKTMRRQTFEGSAGWAVWGPGSDRLTFDSDREGPEELYWNPIDSGPGDLERLSTGFEGYPEPSSWSPDGTKLAVATYRSETLYDIWLVPSDGEAEPFVSTRFNEQFPEFSPDGRWILYTSDESGRDQVYVRPYPGPGSAVQISAHGGIEPAWSRDGSEIFYRRKQRMIAVPIELAGEQLRPGLPAELFEWDYVASFPVRSWDVAPDGRFLAIKRYSATELEPIRELFAPDRIHVVTNWFEELKSKTDAAK